MEEYKAILKVIDDKLKSDEQMLKLYRDKVAELEKENAELKEKIENLTF